MKTVAAFFTFVWHALDGLRKVLHLLILLVIFGVIALLITPHVPVIPSKAVLVVNPQGVLVEQLSGNPLDRALAEAYGIDQAETLVRDVVLAIDTAKDDDRIQAIFLDSGAMTGGGLSKLEDIAAALQRFRAAGKLVIAANHSYEQSQYYLAAHADEIYLDPQGMVYVDGFGYYRLFLKDAIEKLGVDVNVFRAGKFKSYTDQFSRNDMSEQEREESSLWLNSLWNSYQAGIAKARNLEDSSQPEFEGNALTKYIEQIVPSMREHGGDLAKVALQYKLVGELKTRAQVEQRLMALTGENENTHSFHGIQYDEYLTVERPRLALKERGNKQVGVVIASGEILDGSHPPGTIGGDSTAELLREARFDNDVAAVVLRIDSPGGSVYASEVIRREVEALKAAGKPVIASMSSTAASGGYYIAMNADEIWAAPTTLTGSIGVFAVLPTLERSLAKLGVHTDGIGTTPLAGGFSLERSLNAAQKELLQLSVEHEYRQFVDKVARARNKSDDDIDAIAQGRVWSGIHAQERGLVDKLGSFQQAVDAAAARADLGGEYRVKYVEAEQTWRQTFVTGLHMFVARLTRVVAPEYAAIKRWATTLSPLESELRRLARFADPRRAYYYCVCTVQ